MPSHYSTIGLDVTEELLLDLCERATSIETEAGTYYRWTSDSGAELWIQADLDGELVGAHPHFTSDARARIRLDERVEREGDSILDGAYSGWMHDEAYPLIFDCANFHQKPLALPANASVQIAAFAHQLWTFESPEHFMKSQTREVKFASQSFMPASVLDDSDDVAEAFFAGHVTAAAAKTNAITGLTFHWMRVDTLAVTFDVVADPEVAPLPVVGGVVQGTFWLSGYVD